MDSVDVHGVLEKIAATGSRTEKEALVAQHINDPLFRKVVTYAYDPMITFGLTPMKPVNRTGGLAFDQDSEEVWNFLDDLRYRRLTGNAAKTRELEVRGYLEGASDDLLWRILSKDLRAGFTSGTVNRVAPGTIPVFEVARAKHYQDKRVKKFPVAVEPKHDGYRTAVLVRGGEAKFFSRSGKEWAVLEHLAEPVIKMTALAFNTAKASGDTEFLKMFGGGDYPVLALDAEAVALSFKETSSVMRKKDEPALDAVLHIFDAVPFDFMTDDRQKVFETPYETRRKFVEFLIAHAVALPNITYTDKRLAHSHDEIQAIYVEHRLAGLEGAMVKPLDGHYKKDQSFHWMKVKNEETEDRPIKNAVEGEGKNVGKLGALIVDRNGVDAYVGSGFTDKDREEIWQMWLDDPERLKGRLIEIEFNEITPDGNYRHSRFVRFRDDKTEPTIVEVAA